MTVSGSRVLESLSSTNEVHLCLDLLLPVHHPGIKLPKHRCTIPSPDPFRSLIRKATQSFLLFWHSVLLPLLDGELLKPRDRGSPIIDPGWYSFAARGCQISITI